MCVLLAFVDIRMMATNTKTGQNTMVFWINCLGENVEWLKVCCVRRFNRIDIFCHRPNDICAQTGWQARRATLKQNYELEININSMMFVREFDTIRIHLHFGYIYKFTVIICVTWGNLIEMENADKAKECGKRAEEEPMRVEHVHVVFTLNVAQRFQNIIYMRRKYWSVLARTATIKFHR